MHGSLEYQKGGLWFGTSGPPNAPIVLVGESWGAEEDKEKRPFVGTSGTELNRILAEAGLQRDSIFCTNVVAERPNGNEMWRFFNPKSNPSGALLSGLDPRENVRSDIRRLYTQIAAFPRAVVVASGNYALWCLTQKHGTSVRRESNGRPIPPDEQPFEPTGITSQRGSMWYCQPLSELWQGNGLERITTVPCLPIIHPAAIMRDWTQRAVTVHDLKARVPMALRGDWRPQPAPVILAPPTFREAVNRLQLWLSRADGGHRVVLAEDIETYRKTIITCIGFSDSRHFAMSIPFVKRTESSLDSYWTIEEEAILFHLLRRVNSHPNIFICGQNFIYDTQYIQVELGVTPKLYRDSMLTQNVAFPGTPKDLGYLSSLFCQYHWYWKDDSKDWEEVGGSLEQLLQYNAQDCLRTWEIVEAQEGMIKALKIESQIELKMQINDLCLEMMNRGMLFDKKRKAEMAIGLSDGYNALCKELLEIAPQSIVDENYEENVKKGHYSPRTTRTGSVAPAKMKYWYRSDKQTKILFYDILGLHLVKHRKTGKPTTGKEARHEWRKYHPEFTGLFNRIDLAESVDNTAGVINSPLDPDNRIRCSFNPGGTETHRLSSSENAFGRGTNLQNLTKGKEDD